MLENFVPTYDAQAVKQLKMPEWLSLGKTNMDEFAREVRQETSAFSVTRNPWNPEHVPGWLFQQFLRGCGSRRSGNGTRFRSGGSIRQPAAYCVVTGQ